jgi:hypothetical protein
VSRYARAAVLIGRDAPLIRAVLEPAGVPAGRRSRWSSVFAATQRAMPATPC